MSFKRKKGAQKRPKVDESETTTTTTPYALQDKKLRVELEKLCERKVPLTTTQLYAEDELQVQTKYADLWAHKMSKVDRRTLVGMWVLHENLEDGLEHLFVQRPIIVQKQHPRLLKDDSIQIFEERTQENEEGGLWGYYLPENILTRCFVRKREASKDLEESVCCVKMSFHQVYTEFCTLNSDQKKELREELNLVLGMIHSKRILIRREPDINHEFYTQILYAHKGDKVFIHYNQHQSTEYSPIRYKGPTLFQDWRRFGIAGQTGKLLGFTRDQRGGWSLEVLVDRRLRHYEPPPSKEEADCDGFFSIEKPKIETYILVDLNWCRWPYKQTGPCAVLADDHLYRQRAFFDRVTVPALRKQPNLILLNPLLEIVFSFGR